MFTSNKFLGLAGLALVLVVGCSSDRSDNRDYIPPINVSEIESVEKVAEEPLFADKKPIDHTYSSIERSADGKPICIDSMGAYSLDLKSPSTDNPNAWAQSYGGGESLGNNTLMMRGDEYDTKVFRSKPVIDVSLLSDDEKDKAFSKTEIQVDSEIDLLCVSERPIYKSETDNNHNEIKYWWTEEIEVGVWDIYYSKHGDQHVNRENRVATYRSKYMYDEYINDLKPSWDGNMYWVEAVNGNYILKSLNTKSTIINDRKIQTITELKNKSDNNVKLEPSDRGIGAYVLLQNGEYLVGNGLAYNLKTNKWMKCEDAERINQGHGLPGIHLAKSKDKSLVLFERFQATVLSDSFAPNQSASEINSTNCYIQMYDNKGDKYIQHGKDGFTFEVKLQDSLIKITPVGEKVFLDIDPRHSTENVSLVITIKQEDKPVGKAILSAVVKP